MDLYLGITFGSRGENGSVTLAEVDPDGPVARAGGLAGDTLLTIDGISAMAARVAWADGSRERMAGRRMSWMILRDGEKMVLSPAWQEVGASDADRGNTRIAPSADPFAGRFSRLADGAVISRPETSTELVGFTGDAVSPDRLPQRKNIDRDWRDIEAERLRRSPRP